MDFTTDNPLLQSALDAAQTFHAQLPLLAPPQFFDHIYLHWSVEHWGCTDGNYNAEVDLGTGEWVLKITHDPRDNAVDIFPGGAYAAHTYKRNSHAFGFAITGMIGATPSDFGPEAVQYHELEYLCAGAAAVALKYGLDASGTAYGGAYPGSYTIMTHAEAAIADDYFPGDGDPDPRWDLSRFKESASIVTKPEALMNASILRSRIHQYKVALSEVYAREAQTTHG